MPWIDISRVQFQEKMLWACVLRRTIFDYVLYKGMGKHKLRWQQAHKFIYSDQDEGEIGLTFDQICGLFGWDTDYLRRKVKELDRSHIKKLETMKFKEFFDEDTSSIFAQAARWESGQSVPIFAPYNYSHAYRLHMRLQRLRKPLFQRPRSIIPFRSQWSLAFA